jgi:hypothetical protein
MAFTGLVSRRSPCAGGVEGGIIARRLSFAYDSCALTMVSSVMSSRSMHCSAARRR